MKKWIKIISTIIILSGIFWWWASIAYYEPPSSFIAFCSRKINNDSTGYNTVANFADTFKMGKVPFVLERLKNYPDISYNEIINKNVNYKNDDQFRNAAPGQEIPVNIVSFLWREKLKFLGKEGNGRVIFSFSEHSMLFTDKYILAFSSNPIRQTIWYKDFIEVKDKNQFYNSSKWIYLISDNWAVCSN